MSDSPRGTREGLRALMRDNALTRKVVADYLRVSPHTVRAWLKPRPPHPPVWAFDLLRLRIEHPDFQETASADFPKDACTTAR